MSDTSGSDTSGSDTSGDLQTLADRHGFGIETVRHVARALDAGHGTMAQFNHPELGGFGQWSAGGMTMIGDMFNANLKARVADLCADLARSGLPDRPDAASAGAGWWPEELGRPAASGSQNATRYAYFPQARRLAVDDAGTVALYDTGEHDIGGVSQQQGGTRNLRFTGRNGSVDLETLRRLDGPAEAPSKPHPAASKPFEPEPIVPMGRVPGSASTPGDAAPSGAPAGDLVAVIERLSELHRKGVLTESEFTAKKADLLARL